MNEAKPIKDYPPDEYYGVFSDSPEKALRIIEVRKKAQKRALRRLFKYWFNR